MTSYEIQFKNNSTSAYHFGVYQDYPTSPGLKSVVWQVRGLPSRSTNKVDWKMDYQVAIADWDQNEQSYSGQQIVDAQQGNAYQVTIQEGDIPAIDPSPSSAPTSKDQIKLLNATSRELDMGFAVDGNLIAVTSARGNQTANFIIHPTYYVALYRSVKLGNLVDSGLEVGPVKVEFTNGNTKAVVECISQGGRDILKPAVFI